MTNDYGRELGVGKNNLIYSLEKVYKHLVYSLEKVYICRKLIV